MSRIFLAGCVVFLSLLAGCTSGSHGNGQPPAPALISAAWHGDAPAVQVLLHKGDNPDVRASNGATALMIAAQRGYPAIVQALLNDGAGVNATKHDGGTALMAAAYAGHIDVVRILLDNGAAINARSDKGITALFEAAYQRHIEIARMLLDKGADINARSDNGVTALYQAAYEGYFDMVRFLLAHGADVNARTTSGWTAVDVAAVTHHNDVVQVLLAKGAVHGKPGTTAGGTAAAAPPGDRECTAITDKRPATRQEVERLPQEISARIVPFEAADLSNGLHGQSRTASTFTIPGAPYLETNESFKAGKSAEAVFRAGKLVRVGVYQGIGPDSKATIQFGEQSAAAPAATLGFGTVRLWDGDISTTFRYSTSAGWSFEKCELRPSRAAN